MSKHDELVALQSAMLPVHTDPNEVSICPELLCAEFLVKLRFACAMLVCVVCHVFLSGSQ